MKKRFKQLLVCLSLSIPFSLNAQQEGKHEYKRYEHVKERDISKSYPASGNTLNIDNSFGDVTVTTGGSEIRVDIHIEASSSNKEHAEKIFAGIDVTDSKEGNQVRFKTKHRENKDENNNCRNCNSSMQITYKVQLPAGTSLNIHNAFGDIILPDYSGAVSLDCKFGSLKTGILGKAEDISVEFGKADIKEVNNLNSTFKFSTVTIGTLGGNCKLNLEFCKASKINLNSNLTALDLRESYSLISLVPASGFSASYSIRTSFSTFSNKTSADIKRTDEPDQYGPDSERRYEGKSGSGSARVDIRSSFGKVILGEATEEEMRQKDKAKNKKEVI